MHQTKAKSDVCGEGIYPSTSFESGILCKTKYKRCKINSKTTSTKRSSSEHLFAQNSLPKTCLNKVRYWQKSISSLLNPINIVSYLDGSNMVTGTHILFASSYSKAQPPFCFYNVNQRLSSLYNYSFKMKCRVHFKIVSAINGGWVN